MKKNISYLSIAMLFASLAFGFTGQIAYATTGETVNLGSAGNFVILAKTGVSATGATAVVGDIGVSPAAATYITGFALMLPSASAFSTSALVSGKIFSPSYADPTSANLTTAILDMQTAYTDAMGRAPTVTELGAGNIGGLTLPPGVYKWGTGVTVPTDVTLSGSANDIWIFQIAQNLDLSSGVKVVLAGGAKADNVFWAVAGQTTIGTTASICGNILDQTAIVFNTGATLCGRALAQTAVTLDANTVTVPTASVSAPLPTPAPAPTPVSAPTPTPAPTPNIVSVQTSAPVAVQTTAQASTLPALEDTKVQLRAQLDGLLVKLQALKAQQQTVQLGSPASASAFGQQVRTIARDMHEGSSGSHVNTLQQFLVSQGKGSAAKALEQHGTTMFFGPLTKKALAEYQASVGISPASGNFGPLTRGYIVSHTN